MYYYYKNSNKLNSYPISESTALAHTTNDVVFTLALASGRLALKVTLMDTLCVTITILTTNNRIVTVSIGITLVTSSTFRQINT